MTLKTRSMTLLSVLILGLMTASPSKASPLPPEFIAAQKSTSEYWNETGLTYSELSRFVNQAECYSTTEKFVGCVAAVDALAKSAKMAVISYENLWDARPEIGKIIKDFGGLFLVEFSQEQVKRDAENQSPAEWYKIRQREREKEIAALRRLYEDTQSTANFDQIQNEIGPMIFTQNNGREAELTAGAINAFFQTGVDAHTHLQPTQQFYDKKNSLQEKFFGIGATFQKKGDNILVTQLLEKGSALSAGLMPRDILTHVNGQAIEGYDFNFVMGLIRGPENSWVTLTVLRKGIPMEFKIPRTPIISENVSGKIVYNRGEPIGYIKLRSFTDDSACDQIAEKVDQFQNAHVKGMILDLRNNLGGLLPQGICIGGLFVGRKVIVKVKNLDKEFFSDQASRQNAITDLPMVTLINAGSASASEIVAGALQDYQRSWIAGDRSYGKATVQMGVPISNTIMIWKTVQRFYQPSGRTNQIVGILPDFALDPKPNATEEERFALREADIYSNALPALGTPWVQPRTQEVEQIQDCVEKTGTATESYLATVEEPIPADYQILAAEDILACERTLSLEKPAGSKNWFGRFLEELSKTQPNKYFGI